MLAKRILEFIEEIEWDEKWEATLAIPESEAYSAKREKEIMAEHLAGRIIEYTSGKSLEELFR